MVDQGSEDLFTSAEIDHKIGDLLPPLPRILMHLKRTGIEVNPSLGSASSSSLEIHRLLKKKAKNR